MHDDDQGSGEHGEVADAARGVASGTNVDWPALESSAGDTDIRELIRGLHDVERIAAFHRSLPEAAGPAESLTTWGSLGILGEIGRGSSGRVYRARDPKLDRDVALKILDPGLVSDSPKARDVIDEGRHLARLRHPNIVIIHGADRVDGRVGLEMELVIGRTLAEIVQTQGPFAADEAALICRDVSRALAAVHNAGLVHRDVKAQNVIRERGGRVVLMDFGAGRLASVAESASIAGTPLYLAPEVLAGEAPTPRSDLYSLGVLLYYLVTGSFPIQAATIDELREAHRSGRVMRLRDARPDLPERFIQLVEHALAPDPAHRIDSAGTFEAELTKALGQVHQASDAPRAPWRVAVGALAGCVLLGAALVWMAWRTSPVSQPSGTTRLLVSVAPADELGGEEGHPTRHHFTLSPDGRTLVFSALQAGKRRLFLRKLDTLEAVPIPGTDGADSPFFSPDGRSLGFWSNREIRRMPAAGGPVVSVCKTGALQVPIGLTWLADPAGASEGRIVFAREYGGLWQVAATGGTASTLTSTDVARGEVSHRLPWALPDGSGILYTITRQRDPRWDETEIAFFDAASGGSKILLKGGADARLVAGSLLYAREGVLMAAPFDRTALSAGVSRGVMPGLQQAAYFLRTTANSGAAQFAFSNDGTMAYAPGGVFPAQSRELVWITRSGVRQPVGITESIQQVRISPDLQRLAVSTGGRENRIFIYDLARGTSTPLLGFGAASAIWSPLGESILYRAAESGPQSLFRRPSDGSGAAEQLLRAVHNQIPGLMSVDGRMLVYYELPDHLTEAATQIWVMSMTDLKPHRLTAGNETESGITFSPDGKWIAYAASDTGLSDVYRGTIYIQAFPGPGARTVLSSDNGSSPLWRRNGEIAYLRPGPTPQDVEVMSVSVSTTTPKPLIGTPIKLFHGPFLNIRPSATYDLTPNGDRFLMVLQDPRPPIAITKIVVAHHWLEDLHAR